MFNPWFARILGGVLLICLVLIGILAIYPGTTSIDTDHSSGAHIHFEVARRWVVRPGDCTTVKWDVEGIQHIYVDGVGQVGQGSCAICVEEEKRTTTLTAHFRDDTTQDFTLDVGTLTYAPGIWLLGGLALTCGIALLALGGASLASHRVTLGRASPWLSQTATGLNLLIFSLLITLISMELGLRWYFDTQGTPDQKVKYRYSDADFQDHAAEDALPVLGYGIPPTEQNPLGYRGAAVAIPKPADTYRIAVLGDSTVFGLGVGAADSFPAQLQQQLARDYGLEHVEVVNAGVPGYNSWHSTVNLALRVLELEPDLIMIIHTISEIGVRELSPECYRSYDQLRGLYPHSLTPLYFDQVPTSSALVRFIGINLGWIDAPSLQGGTRLAFDCVDDPRPAPGNAMQLNPPVYFERNFRSMIGTAQSHDVDVLLTTWTYDAAIPPEDGPDWWRSAVDEHNAIITALAEEFGTYYFDLTRTPLRDDPANWGGDHVHGTPQGYTEQARLVAQAIVDAGIIGSE